jgi:muramoyltetrapeptide carboxypeptidase
MATAGIAPSGPLHPEKLKPGDRVRFVSPASPVDEASVRLRIDVLASWGLVADCGRHAFRADGYLAGSDEERRADLDTAFRDPAIRAIFATRGGKGSYRIADQLDVAAVRRDPKFLVGFSDISALHLSLARQCGLVGLHGALVDDDGAIVAETAAALRRALMAPGFAPVRTRPEEATARLTTAGSAVGRLIGGNLDMVATTAGWGLPDLNGAILLLEAVAMPIGQIDRQLTLLVKGGHLAGVAGIALGQLTGFDLDRRPSVVDLLRDHLGRLSVPILGGLPLGHGARPEVVPVGAMAVLDADAGILSFPD